MQNVIVSYAQNREDIIIDAFFPDVKKGFYVDVGANHPLYHSVTKLFYDKGWRGINFEPNPPLFVQMKEHRPGDTNLMQGLGDKPGSLELRVYHSRDGLEGISTLSKSMKDDYSSHSNLDTKKFDDVKIEVRTLKDVLGELKVPHIHFMKVDVEGFEYEVLKGNDWKKFRPELICIESNHIMNDWRPILRDANYSLAFNDGLNDYYLAEESKARAKNFDYAQVFLGTKHIVGFDLSEEMRVIRENAVNQVKSLESQLGEKQKRLNELQTYINEITPLKKHIKRQVKQRTNKLRGNTPT